jgi:integrase/recombinase XerC
VSLEPLSPSSLLERTRNLAVLSEDELKRFAAEAARDRDTEALWALLEAFLTLHGSSGSRVSLHTLSTYKRGLKDLLKAWQGENLLRPKKNAGVLYVRELEGRLKPASVGVKLAAAKAFYAALRWSGVTDTAPFADVKAAIDKTPAWEKREAYTSTEVHWLIRVSESYTLYIVLLGAHAGLRVSEMTNLKWEDVDLSEGTLKVVSGKGGKTASVNLSSTLVAELERTPLGQRQGYVLPARSRIAVYKRIEAACRAAKVKFKGVHALRHASGTRLLEATGDITLTADHLRHSSLDTARGYAKRSNQQLKKAVGEW